MKFRLASRMIVCAIIAIATSTATIAAKPGKVDKNAPKKFTKTKYGLKYKILRKAKGAKPKATDRVTVHYRGWLPVKKGQAVKYFDSSYKRNQPATFPVSGVIKGWTEALQLMKVGSKWKLFVPSGLAYGENPRAGSPIGPNAMLVFEVELLEIVK